MSQTSQPPPDICDIPSARTASFGRFQRAIPGFSAVFARLNPAVTPSNTPRNREMSQVSPRAGLHMYFHLPSSLCSRTECMNARGVVSLATFATFLVAVAEMPL